MTFSYIGDLDEMVGFIHAVTQQIISLFLPRPRPTCCSSRADRHSCSQAREWEGKDNSLPSSILASAMHAMPFWAWAPFASHKLKCTWKVSRFPQTPSFQREWFLSTAHVFRAYILVSTFTQNIPTYWTGQQGAFWRTASTKLLTSDAGTCPPIHGTQPGDSGSEGLLSLQTTFPRSPRTAAALSVHWLCQTPKI